MNPPVPGVPSEIGSLQVKLVATRPNGELAGVTNAVGEFVRAADEALWLG